MKKGTHHSKKTKIILSNLAKGRVMSEEQKQKISRSLKGKPLTYKRIILENQKKKISKALKGIKKPELSAKFKALGIKPPSNKGKQMSKNEKEKHSQAMINHFNKVGRKKHRLYRHIGLEYILWRKAIYERDNYICQSCGQKGGKIVAHHILSWAKFPHKRYDITNGLTLCKKCHKETENYGNKKSNK